MPYAARIRLALPLLIATIGLCACLTPTAKPQASQAVLESRARRNAPPPPSCPTDPVSSVSPVTMGFAFNDTELTPAMTRSLDGPARWLSCHPTVAAVIRPDADSHGTEAEQDRLARQRAEIVRSYLASHGVPAAQIRILSRAAPEPQGEMVLIRAEGRRW